MKSMNRRGITPIIAVVLLLMMTVAAAGAAFFWITTIQSRIQGQIGTQVSTTTTQTGAGLNIIALICNSTASNQAINVTLQNTGTSTIQSGTVALTITDNQNRVIKVVPVTSSSNFNQNEIRTMSSVIDAGTLRQNSTYGVKITMPGGIEGTSDCVAQGN